MKLGGGCVWRMRPRGSGDEGNGYKLWSRYSVYIREILNKEIKTLYFKMSWSAMPVGCLRVCLICSLTSYMYNLTSLTSLRSIYAKWFCYELHIHLTALNLGVIYFNLNDFFCVLSLTNTVFSISPNNVFCHYQCELSPLSSGDFMWWLQALITLHCSGLSH